jgi:hypothetical protein
MLLSGFFFKKKSPTNAIEKSICIPKMLSAYYFWMCGRKPLKRGDGDQYLHRANSNVPYIAVLQELLDNGLGETCKLNTKCIRVHFT